MDQGRFCSTFLQSGELPHLPLMTALCLLGSFLFHQKTSRLFIFFCSRKDRPHGPAGANSCCTACGR